MDSRIRRIVPLAALPIVLLASGILAGAGHTAQAAPSRAGVTLNLVAYSTPAAAYSQIIPAFQKTKAGQGVTINTSFDASGVQSQKVTEGLPADVVEFSLEPDMARLVKAHMVSSNWSKNQYNGIVTRSIVVFGVRRGNPKHIHTWADLVKKGVDVVTPNPFTSGGARWNVMAAYGAQIYQHKTPAQAINYLKKLFANVSVQDSSARQELQTFVGGKGDVMISYENEAIAAQQAGNKIDYVIPPQSILIENPLAATSTSKNPTQAAAFVKFLYGNVAQRIFGEKGYRPVNKTIAKEFNFKNPKTLFTIRNLGGWTKVQTQFFDPQNGIMASIERSKGVSP
jgi:sulfate transport system substrate-binding protein